MSHLFQAFRARCNKFAQTAQSGNLRWSWRALFIVPVAIFVNDALVEVNSVNGQSMAPTLSPNFDESGSRDWLAVWKLGVVQNVRRGDIVAFWSPHNPESLSVKRVIATAGDTVYPKRGQFKEELVPYGHVWVEGDNWRKTVDSNDYGPISKALITGRATYVVWPWRRMGALSTEWRHPRTRVVPGEAVMPKEYME
ncbi:MAG: hypothetical protein M1821_008169 [Bathelium mastoideum]|nr:MAG: hypothetical protein M1821_008169 [Bathelium mastoideum]KAI9693214.1 MAG: hypothetical protein M1822_005210 [Bathelium mastoideum]